MANEANKEIDSGFDDFYKEMQGVNRLKSDNRVFLNSATNKEQALQRKHAIEAKIAAETNYLTLEAIDPLDPHACLDYKQPGIQDGVYKNLRLGKYKLENTIHLTNMKLERAQEITFESISHSYKKGHRAILIKHGIGLQQKPYPGLTKSYVNVWLKQMPMVIAFHSAQRQHGGYGATYVLLKKNEERKANNREQHKQK